MSLFKFNSDYLLSQRRTLQRSATEVEGGLSRCVKLTIGQRDGDQQNNTDDLSDVRIQKQ